MSLPKYLRDHKAEIAREKTSQQRSIPYHAQLWKKWHPKNRTLKSILEDYSSSISRKDIFKMRRDIGANPTAGELKKLFLAVMLWGYGPNNRGPWRTEQMVSDPGFSKIIKSAFNAIQRGDIEQAYKIFRPGQSNNLKGCGPAFFTKYFYFCGTRKKNMLKPLILDSVVTKAIERKKKCNTDIKSGAKRYIKYLKDMEDWAKQLKVEPDQIELFLFESEE